MQSACTKHFLKNVIVHCLLQIQDTPNGVKLWVSNLLSIGCSGAQTDCLEQFKYVVNVFPIERIGNGAV